MGSKAISHSHLNVKLPSKLKRAVVWWYYEFHQSKDQARVTWELHHWEKDFFGIWLIGDVTLHLLKQRQEKYNLDDRKGQRCDQM